MKLISLLLILAFSTQSLADNCLKCDNALKACKAFTIIQDVHVTHLKQSVKRLEVEVVKGENRESILPWWGYIIFGAAGALAVRGAFSK